VAIYLLPNRTYSQSGKQDLLSGKRQAGYAPLVKIAFTELDIQTVISAYKNFFSDYKAEQRNISYKEEIRQNVMEEINNCRAHHLGPRM
jgi:hypothetical protein